MGGKPGRPSLCCQQAVGPGSFPAPCTQAAAQLSPPARQTQPPESRGKPPAQAWSCCSEEPPASGGAALGILRLELRGPLRLPETSSGGGCRLTPGPPGGQLVTPEGAHPLPSGQQEPIFLSCPSSCHASLNSNVPPLRGCPLPRVRKQSPPAHLSMPSTFCFVSVAFVFI